MTLAAAASHDAHSGGFSRPRSSFAHTVPPHELTAAVSHDHLSLPPSWVRRGRSTTHIHKSERDGWRNPFFITQPPLPTLNMVFVTPLILALAAVLYNMSVYGAGGVPLAQRCQQANVHCLL